MSSASISDSTDHHQATWFAEILLPVPIPKTFTYRVPLILNAQIQIGQRAIVQFGDRKILTGLVIELHENAPKDYEAKYILELLDESPIVTSHQQLLFEWIANYYMCNAGEVMNAALPSGLKLSSESMVQLRPGFQWEDATIPFSDNELLIIKSLQDKSLSYSEIAKLLGLKNIYSIIKSLVSKEAILLYEEVKEKYKPKTESRIRLNEKYANNIQALEDLFHKLSSKPKQEEVLLKYLQEVPVMQQKQLNEQGMPKHQLIAEGISESSLNTLIKNNVLELFQVIVSRFGAYKDEKVEPIQLSDKQEQILNGVLEDFKSKDACLLQGVTGSGKTELYIELIRRAIEGGSQVLYLLPEIALTTQIVARLKKIFGDTMGVYHSKFSDNERVEVWNGMLNGRFKFVIGVRSAVLLPFDDLSLIIVDEEHDASYKQQDPAPRYHAKDVALKLAQLHKAKVLLGSATPSLESMFLAEQNKIAYHQLHERYGDAQLPAIMIADMKRERLSKTVKGGFSSLLLNELKACLKQKEQAIIFQNRRGYAPSISCEDCGWIPQCVNCSVSMTYHQYKESLVCHYCGYKEKLYNTCPTCTSTRIKTIGYGTEKLEEQLSLYFPDARIQRMDLDTTRAKSSYENIIEGFATGETDILVGTQMVTKGLDFDKVSLVGIFDADRMMHFPDFRSHERAFQMITQVSGRAGRRDKQGKVIIQSANPAHQLLQHIINGDQSSFYEQELHDRLHYGYPPFTRLINITIKHQDVKICIEASRKLTEMIAANMNEIKVFGPAEPMVSKIRNQYLRNILIKIKRESKSLGTIKSHLNMLADQLLKEKSFRQCRIIFDVDPV
ncbi:MAG TPA: primosomal protein N' [Cyclobacteriaceae bacterium]|nr:primosomal protein N' [Cyclobacteriaceae bacterium]